MEKYQENEELIYEMIIEDLDETISPENKLILEQWRLADQRNEKTYRDLLNVQNSIDKLYNAGADADASWNALEKKIDLQGHPQLVPTKYRIGLGMVLRFAAVFAVILSVAYFFMAQDKYAVISNGTTSGIAKIVLPDETIVNLNAGTKIKYDKENFLTNKTLEVLDGEVFVQVVKHDGAKLKVVVGEVEAEDIGTSFNVSKNDDDVVIAVEEGLVAMKHNHNDEQQLIAAGNKGAYNSKTRELVVSEITDHNYKAWLNKHFTFNDMPLSEVAQQLQKAYQVPVVVNGDALNQKKFTLNKLHYQTIDSALSVISASLQFKITKEKGAYVLSDN